MHGITERGATRWVFVRILPAKTAATARRFLRDLHRACPIRIARILTDQALGRPLVRETMARGKEFTDQLCTELGAEPGIEHRLTPPKSPPTNGMVERFNGRISDVLETNRFDNALDLEQTLMRYVVRRSLGPMAFTAHSTTRNCRNQP